MAVANRRRATHLLLVSLLAFGLMSVKLLIVQGVKAEGFSKRASAQRLRHIELPAKRGAIVDRNDALLAISSPARTIFANPRQVNEPVKLADLLARELKLDAADVMRKLTDTRRGFVYVARQIPADVAERITKQASKDELIGLSTLDEATRDYPASVGAGVVGAVGLDGKGLSGIEIEFNRWLTGTEGFRVLEQDTEGRRIPQATFSEVPPVPGGSVMLSLNRDIQHATSLALAKAVELHSAKGGMAVVLDVETGEVLALASNPTFDPMDLSSVDPQALKVRAVTDVFEPGSVGKLVTIGGAIEDGVVTPTSAYQVPYAMRVAGREFSDAYKHGTKTMTVNEIFSQSSNIGTIKVGLALGAKRLDKWTKAFGYGLPAPLGLPSEATGQRPSAARWGTSLPTMSIGQGISATPLELARMFQAIANDGLMIQPRLVLGKTDPNGSFTEAPEGEEIFVVSPETAAAMREMMRLVVADGTGKLAQVAGYEVGGKTGTAQKAVPGGYRGYMSSFYGIAPVDSPRIVVGITLDDPGSYYGGVVAAPAFSEVATAALRILRVPQSSAR